jgi:hypothetical protein
LSRPVAVTFLLTGQYDLVVATMRVQQMGNYLPNAPSTKTSAPLRDLLSALPEELQNTIAHLTTYLHVKEYKISIFKDLQ